MDKTILRQWPVYHEERFRTPLEAERQAGLWVDRIGRQSRGDRREKLRRLGQYAAVLIEEGHGTLICGEGGEYPLAPGDVVVLFAEVAAVYNPLSRWSEKWIVWNGSEAARLEEMGYLLRHQPVIADELGVFAEAFGVLSRIIDLQDKGAILERKIIVTRLIAGLYRQMRRGDGEEGTSPVEQAVEYLSRHYDEDMAISTLAERFHLSETYFRARFKEYTGTSPRKFVTGLRISQAKKLLSRRQSVKETAAQVGYRDVFYFMRIFKKVTGVAAGTWQLHYLGEE